jgi:hypothetical protein
MDREIKREMDLSRGWSIGVGIEVSGSRTGQQGRDPHQGTEVGASVSGLAGGGHRFG